MKRFFIYLLVSIIFVTNGISQSVTKNEAETAAKNFYSHQLSKITGAKADVSILNSDEIIINNVTAIYVFNMENGGYVLTSSDKNSLPVLAYSFETNIDINNLNPACQAWVDNYCDQVMEAKLRKSYVSNNNIAWKNIIANNFSAEKSENSAGVLPLLATNWNQGYPYQLLCPPASISVDDSVAFLGRKFRRTCVTGCVATAMAQIMKYYNYPAGGLGMGSYYFDGDYVDVNFSDGSYNWNNMLNTYGNMWALDTVKAYAVAKLMFHAGVSVYMDYGADLSGTQSSYVPDALKQNFQYRGGISQLSRNDIPTNEWIHKLITELDLSRPVYYSGSRTDNEQVAGHAFVVDGYQSGEITSYFHFNWGWGGSDNGYFNVDYASQQGGVSSSMLFSNGQSMITNILPMGAAGINFKDCKGKVVIPFAEGTIDDGSGPNICKANTDCEWLFTIDDIDTNVVKFDSLMITFNYVKLGANDTIKIYNGVDASSPLIATLTSEDNYNVGSLENIAIFKTPNYNPDVFISFTTGETTNGDGWELSYKTFTYISTDVTLEQLNQISLYPNPANDVITFSGLTGNENVEILDITGRTIYSTTGNNNVINISDFNAGMYLAVITVDSRSKVVKFVKE